MQRRVQQLSREHGNNSTLHWKKHGNFKTKHGHGYMKAYSAQKTASTSNSAEEHVRRDKDYYQQSLSLSCVSSFFPLFW